MISGKTKSGIAFEFDKAALDDMRFVDLLCVIMDEEAAEFDRLSASSKAIALLLGPAQKAALYEHIAAAHGGRVPAAVLQQELTEIILSVREDAGKN